MADDHSELPIDARRPVASARDDPRTSCDVCGRPASSRFAHCFCCATSVRQLGMPLVPVVSMADYRVGDRLHDLLRGYKDAATREARTARTVALSALVELWLAANADRLRAEFGSCWELVATVPSTSGRSRSPADALVQRVPELARLNRPVLVRGWERIGHLEAARCGFALDPGLARHALRDRRALVFDDSVTTGSRAQSAAAVLRRGGARVVGILAVGRALGASGGSPRSSTRRPDRPSLD